MSTVVSCYYKISSKKPHSVYLEYISNFMSLKFDSVIFCNRESHEILSTLYPENNNRKYRIVEITDFVVNQFDWEYDLLIDPEKSIHSVDLYKVWNEKIFFVERAIRENMYNSSAFFWTDIGSFRDKTRLVDFRTYPSSNYLVKDRVSFSLINQFHTTEIEHPELIDSRFLYVNRISAGIFGGFIEPLLKYRDLYLEMLGNFHKVFKGKDQSVVSFVFIQNMNLFDICLAEVKKGYDKWFYMHYYFSIGNIYNDIPIKDLPVIYISPDHNEKYKNRKIKLEKTLENIGFKNITHFKSGTEKYPKCLVKATISILEANMNNKPIIVLEDDVAWTSIDTIDIPEDADAVYLGLTFSGGHPIYNTHLPGISCQAKPYTKKVCKINNMRSSHAILYISERYKKAVVEQLGKISDMTYNDVAMSRLHRFYKIYAINTPIFYQDAIATTKRFDFTEKNELGVYNL